MLEPYRVVEVAGYGTALCGQMLGDLGADVVVVEPPEGAALRMQPPFYGEVPHLDRSLAWWATNRNKRGVSVSVVQTIVSIFSEAQLAHRRHFVRASHAMLGEAWVENSRTAPDTSPDWTAPSLLRHP
jgi:hypothetical protein